MLLVWLKWHGVETNRCARQPQVQADALVASLESGAIGRCGSSAIAEVGFSDSQEQRNAKYKFRSLCDSHFARRSTSSLVAKIISRRRMEGAVVRSTRRSVRGNSLGGAS